VSDDSPSSRGRGPASGDRYRRTWPQRFTLVAGMALVVLSLASAWGLSEVYNSIGEVPRIEVAAGILEEELQSATEPRNILLVGTTSLEGLSEDDYFTGIREDENLADTIMLLRIEPVTAQATVMSINRDVKVPNAAGYSGKINGAYSHGGMELLLQVVKEMLNVPIDDFAVVHFGGFRQLIDELDGVPVYFPYDARDDGSFFEIEAGCHVLDGQTALNYVRSRKYEVDKNDDGKFEEADAQTDYDRAERQRDFLILTIERAIDRGVTNPNEMSRLVRAVLDGGAVQIDERLTIDDILGIGRAYGSFDPETLQRWQLPVLSTTNSTELRVNDVEAEPMLNYFRGLGYTIANSDVRPRVLDARSSAQRSNDAIRPDRDLNARGFVAESYRNASQAEATDRTTITYTAENEGKANLLARYLGSRPRLVAVQGRGTLTLTVASDWAGTRDQPMSEEEFAQSAPATPTTTPAPGSTATDPPSTTAAPPDDDTSGDIVGKPPEGVTCE
jgi:LCP family protein required for cell wall assembly